MQGDLKFTIGEGAETLTLRVLRYWPGPDYYSDRCDCEVNARLGGFGANFRCDIPGHDLRRFLDELRKLDSSIVGKAVFETLERQVAFTLKGDQRGHIQIAGTLVDSIVNGNRLSFDFQIDQSYLPSLIQDLSSLLANLALAEGA